MLKKATEIAVKMGYVDEDEQETTEGNKDLSGKPPDLAASITKSIWGLFQVDTSVFSFSFSIFYDLLMTLTLGFLILDF